MSKPMHESKKGGAHPGFDAIASKMAGKQGIPKAQADAELAASTRRASPAAKAANPRLSKVKGC